MGEKLSVAETLERAADLIEPEGAWTKDWFAKDAAGRDVDAGDCDAVCWCVRGAVHHVSGEDEPNEEQIFAPLRAVLGEGVDVIEGWNDADETTQAEVVAKLREAAALARERGL